MISLDSSIFSAILIFLLLVFALNRLLFGPLLRGQSERAERTTGLMAQAQHQLDHHLALFSQYQEAIKTARLEGYRRQEQLRSEALQKKTETLARARKDAEQMVQTSRELIQAQVEAARKDLALEARELAQGITASVLQRSA